MAASSILKESGQYPFETFSEVIRQNALLHPDDEAFVIGSERVTFADFNKRVNRLIHALRAAGCEKGDVLGIMSWNCIEYIEVYGAAMKGGYILTHLSPRISKKELEEVVAHTGIKVLFCASEFSETVRAFQRQVEGLKHWIVLDEEFPVPGYQRFLEGHDPDEVDVDLTADDPLTIIFTRGTSGPSKGALFTHRQKLANSLNRAIELGAQFENRNLVALPIFHIAGESHMWPFFLMGGCSVIMKEIVFNPLGMLRAVQDEKITDVFLLSSQLITLLNTPNIDKYDIRSLKRIWYSAGTIPMDILKRGMKIFGPVFIQGYGSTEAGPDIAMLSREAHAAAVEQAEKQGVLLSCGQPSLGVQVRIVDDADRDLPTGETGEIVAYSGHLMSEYWGRPEETERVLKNGWLHTGDMGYLDEDGFLYVADRKADMIHTDSGSICSRNVEAVLRQHFAVSEVAVIGVQDSVGADHIMGVVVLIYGAQEVTAEDIIRFCKGRIEPHKIPERIEFVTTLPKSSQGTILKRELRKQYSNMAEES